MDDSLDSIVWSRRKPTKAKLAQLEKERAQALRITRKASVDIFELYPPMLHEQDVRLNDDHLEGIRWALAVALGAAGAPEVGKAKDALFVLEDA